MERILVIDDDVDITATLSRYLKKNGFDVAVAHKGEEGLKAFTQESFDLVLSDFRLPDIGGLELIKALKGVKPSVPVIVITGYSDIKIAVETIKLGAYDYVTKPIYPEEILSQIKKALVAAANAKPEIQTAAKAPKKAARRNNSSSESYVVGDSSLSKSLYDKISLVAPTDITVIISGETGTGKEYVAREIHARGSRSSYPFVAIDCGALPNDLAGSEFFGHVKGAFTGAIANKVGSFELATGGTLFLDEIANLSYDIQAKLLRALQERKVRKIGGTEDTEVDCRIIVASNENLKQAVRDGHFREDLYHRLNEFSLSTVPLRSRKDDIPTFAAHFQTMANEDLNRQTESISDEAMKILRNYAWPGNLRELRNVVKRAVLLTQGAIIEPNALPDEIRFHQEDNEAMNDAGDLKAATENAERKTILNALEESRGNKSKAATLLNIDRKTLYNKLKSYKISF